MSDTTLTPSEELLQRLDNADDATLVKYAYQLLGHVVKQAHERHYIYDDMPELIAIYPSIADRDYDYPLIRRWKTRGSSEVLWEVDFLDGTPVVKRNYRW